MTSHRAAPAAPHADPASPYVYDLRPLGRRPGSMRAERRNVPALAGLGGDLIGVVEDTPVTLDVKLESVTEGVLVTGTVTATLTGQCARCLDPITDGLAVELLELFAYPDSATDETTGEDEVYRIDVDHLDLAPVVRDVVVTALPWTPLCRADCRGLCPDCGQRLDDLPDDHAHERLDPRWAGLAALVGGEHTDSHPGDQSASTTKE